MLNTCSIGRRWKSREGWSRPVLTGERGTLFPTLVGRVSSCGGFLVGWQGTLFLVVTTILVRRLSFASVVRFPDRHDRNRSCGWFRCRPPVFPVGRLEWFCGGHGPGETPGPFPNPEAKAWHGDGTALERVWESSAPPHSHVGGSRRASAPGTPIFYALLCRPADRSPLPRGFPSGLSRCSASGLFHAPGDLERRGISGISGEPLALIRWLNRLKNYALFRTQTLCRIEQNHVSRQSNSPAGRRPKLA